MPQDNVQFAKLKSLAHISGIIGCCFQVSGAGPEKC